MVKKGQAKDKIKPKKEAKKKAKKVDVKGVKIEITLLKKVPAKNEFVLADGRKLKNLKELAFCLSDMADEVFWHHVNDARNDFANWIEEIIKEKELADNLKGIRDKVHTQVAILKHIVNKVK